MAAAPGSSFTLDMFSVSPAVPHNPSHHMSTATFFALAVSIEMFSILYVAKDVATFRFAGVFSAVQLAAQAGVTSSAPTPIPHPMSPRPPSRPTTEPRP